MEASLRRPSTIRRTSRGDSDDSAKDSYECISFRIGTQDGERENASQDQLFSLFTSLVAEVHLSVNTVGDRFLEGIINKDIAVADFGTQFIGRGRSFSVRLLKLEPPDRSLVVKSVHPFGDFTSREEKERLADVILELRALSHGSLRGHPNIIELLGLCWETDSVDIARKWPALILEYADGGTLEDFLQRYPDIAFRERLELCLDVSNGLDALHSCGIVHGDLKPGNVLICGELNNDEPHKWMAKLADFGGSVLDVGENELGRLSMGSFPWQAPEWHDWLSRKNLLATDVYSLGLLTWSVMARGLEPAREDLEFLDLENYSAESKALQSKVSMLKSEKPQEFLDYLKRSARRRFAMDVDHALIGEALSITVAKNPESRSNSELNRLLEDRCMVIHGSRALDQTSQARSTTTDNRPRFNPITTIANMENILVRIIRCLPGGADSNSDGP
jgi:serine/threonine protein kinase